MSAHLSVTVAPADNDSGLVARMGGTDPYPLIEIPGTCLSVILAQHDDPAAWLRESAARLTALAVLVDQQRAEQATDIDRLRHDLVGSEPTC